MFFIFYFLFIYFFVVYVPELTAARVLVLNGRVVFSNEIKIIEGRFMANLRYFPGVWLEELRKTSRRIAGNGADTYTLELTNLKKEYRTATACRSW